MVGLSENIVHEYQNCDIFILTSRVEGLPNVVLEAMSHGIPVISFDSASGVREIMEIDRKKRIIGFEKCSHGILVEMDNIEALAEAIEFLSSDLQAYHEISKAGIERAKNFDLSIQVDKLTKWF